MTVIRTVWNDESRMAWPLCLRHFHLRSFGSSDEMSCCFCARHTGMDQDGKQVEQSQTMKDFDYFEHHDTPELRELLSKKGLNTLHQNITGLLGKKPRIIMSNIGCFQERWHFSASGTQLPSVDEAQAQIDGFTFVGKSRTSGQGGAVGASNISSRILIATLN